MKKALLYLLVFILVQFLCTYAVVIPWGMAGGKSMNEVLLSLADGSLYTIPMLIVTSALTSIVTMAFFLGFRWCEVSRHYLRTRPWGVLFWASLIAIGAAIPSQWLMEQLQFTDTNAGLFSMMMSSPWGYVALCLLAPLAEEMVFRGAILRALLGSYRPWLAILVSALFFSAVHANPAQMPHAFFIGLLMGWIYWRTGSILPCVALHWVNNTIAYVTFRLMPGMEDMTLSQLFGSEGRALLSVAFSFCILLPALYQLHLRMKRV